MNRRFTNVLIRKVSNKDAVPHSSEWSSESSVAIGNQNTASDRLQGWSVAQKNDVDGLAICRSALTERVAIPALEKSNRFWWSSY